MLRRDGLILLKARSGPQALELLLQHDVAFALVDIQMPEMDGFELAELIRGMEGTRRIPIIFLTAGGADRQRRFRGYKAGAVNFIRKPADSDILRSKPEVFYELYRQRQEVAHQRDELQAAANEIARLLEESRRQAQALREIDRRKDEFPSTLAHELRNPLAPIRNAVAVMRTKGLGDPELESMREVIDRQAGHMARLVDELLDVSRIATGKLALRCKKLSRASLITAAIEVAGSVIKLHQHRLEVVLPDTEVFRNGDEVRLTQVFANLLTNAAKYSEPCGQIHVMAEIQKNQLRVCVRDHGVGIPKDMLKKVFGLFTQIDGSLDRAQGGLGVGLALVRRLVELHGGNVVAESDGPGCGSEFIVTLPINQWESNGVRTETNHSTDLSTSQQDGALRVLVVDDNVDAAMSLGMLLNLKRHQTKTAHSGPAGLVAARDFRPDIIFMDIGLPGMNGYEVARILRKEPQFEHATLVALTGYATDEDKQLAREAGFDCHLTKPASMEMVDKTVADVVADVRNQPATAEALS